MNTEKQSAESYIDRKFQSAGPNEKKADAVEENTLSREMEMLDAFVGKSVVTQQIRNWVDSMRLRKAAQSAPPTPGNYLFVGNPGTGKTTVARLMGGILKSLGSISTGHVVEVKRADLVAGYSGQTAIKTKERLKDALGGVLFLDEAYSLVQGEQDSFGIEALDTLIAFMEDNSQNLCVIFAGNPEPISELIKRNPGLSFRFDETFVFKNYSPEEMVEIFRHMASEKKLTLAPEVPGVLLSIFTALTVANDSHFGNAHEVRKLFEAARQNISVRVMRETNRKLPDDLSLLTVADITSAAQQNKSAEKNEPNEIEKKGLAAVHGLLPAGYIIEGVTENEARRMAAMLGQVLTDCGVISGGQVVEATRADLVAGYIGMTSVKTREKIQQALGGVLVLFEAEFIAGDNDSFGEEALATLVESIKEYQGRFLLLVCVSTMEWLKKHPEMKMLIRIKNFEETTFGKP